ncbi:Smr/MutS family protein [Candidatus Peregrinibacteria bacterium]|nr:Smr/MutS family protein [Candidatus Peregrinibacteria bacterium]
MNDEELDALLKEYASPAQVNEALSAKESDKGTLSVGEQVKHYPKPQRELDLHGKIANEAMREIDHFLQNAGSQRIRTVRIITGKGLHSPNMRSILPEVTEQKIAELKRVGNVLTFKKEKGGGAFVVYLP